MLYQCQNKSCLHTFTHPAKNIESPYSELKATMYQIETYMCPFCKSIDFSEYIDLEADSPNSLEDMQLVEFKDVVAFIAKGYVELDRKDHVFAKGIVMLKTKPKVVDAKNPDPDSNEAVIESNEKTQLINEVEKRCQNQAEVEYSKIPERTQP